VTRAVGIALAMVMMLAIGFIAPGFSWVLLAVPFPLWIAWLASRRRARPVRRDRIREEVRW
jgi:hypothetical protein